MQCVTLKREKSGAGNPGHRMTNGTGGQRRNICSIRNGSRPLNIRMGRSSRIKLLPRQTIHHVLIETPRKTKHGTRVQVCRHQGGKNIRAPRSLSHPNHPQTTGHPGIGISHVTRRLFMTGVDNRYGGVDTRIDNRQQTLATQHKDVTHSFALEHIDKQLTTVTLSHDLPPNRPP